MMLWGGSEPHLPDSHDVSMVSKSTLSSLALRIDEFKGLDAFSSYNGFIEL